MRHSKIIYNKPRYCSLCGIILNGYSNIYDHNKMYICDICNDEQLLLNKLDKLDDDIDNHLIEELKS